MTVVWAVLAGGVGALVRAEVTARAGVRRGTAIVNLVGAALLGLVVGLAGGADAEEGRGDCHHPSGAVAVRRGERGAQHDAALRMPDGVQRWPARTHGLPLAGDPPEDPAHAVDQAIEPRSPVGVRDRPRRKTGGPQSARQLAHASLRGEDAAA